MSYRPKRLVTGLLASLFCSSVSFAEPAQDRTAGTDWSGYYFGASLATPRGGTTWKIEDMNLALAQDGWDGSAMVLTLGHDWQKGRLTFGASFSAGKGAFVSYPQDVMFWNCEECDTIVSELFTLRGRAGISFDRTLLYVSGGIAQGRGSATNFFGQIPIADKRMTGWVAGVGVEHKLGDNLSLALSYDRVDLGTLDISEYFPGSTSEVQLGIVQVGMNVHW